MEDIVIVESKDYAQVIFEDVHECYSESKDLICTFTLNEYLEIDKNDFIGIYKVGFTKCTDYLIALNIKLNEINECNKGKLVFTADKLPKDDGEFYQFVYMSLGKQIRGASLPFQFKRTYLSDYVEIDDQEAVVFKLKESQINDTLSEMKHKCANLTQANETYERLVKENDESIRMLKDEVTNVKMRCLRLTMENEKVNYALQAKNDTCKNMNSLLEALKSDMEALKLNKDKIEVLLTEKESELAQFKKEKDEFMLVQENLQKNNDHVNELEKQYNERVEELNKLKDDLKRHELMVAEQTQTIQTILTERDSLNALIENLTKEKSDLELSRDTMSQELLMSKDKLMAVEQCKELMRAQLAITISELDSTRKKINERTDEYNRLVEKDKINECEKIELLEKMSKMKEDYEYKLEQSNGSYYALNLAHVHLENRMKSNQNKYEKEYHEHKDLLDTIKSENENLKQRIRAGACEYASLNNKYLMLKNALRLTKSMSASCIFNNSNKYDDVDSAILEDQKMFDGDNFEVLKSVGSNKQQEQKMSISTISSFQHIEDNGDSESQSETSPNLDLNNNNDTHNRIETNTQIDNLENRISVVRSNCELCDYAFPLDSDIFAYEMHMSTHYGPSCPVCFFTFRKGYPQSDFENHVNSHFTS